MKQGKLRRVLMLRLSLAIVILQIFSCSFVGEQPENVEEVEKNAVFGTLLNTSFDLIEKDSLDKALGLLDSAKNLDCLKSSLGICYNTIGLCHDKKGDLHEALKSYAYASSIFIEIDDSTGLAQTQINSASCYKIMGIYDRAIMLAIYSEKYLRRDTNHFKELAVVYNLIGNIHTENENFSLAMDYHTRSLKIRLNRGGALGISSAPAINNLGFCYFKQNILDTALMYFKQYKVLAESIGSDRKLARSYLNMAKVYLKQGKLQTAFAFLSKSEQLYKELSYKPGLLNVHLLKSKYYLKSNLILARVEALEALRMASFLDFGREKLQALKLLEGIMGTKKLYAKAYEYAQQHFELKNKLEGKEQLSKIYSYEIAAQLDQKNIELIDSKRKRDLSELKNKKSIQERNFFILLGLLTFLLAIVMIYRYLDKKRFVEEYFASNTGVILKSSKKILFEDIQRVETLRNDLVLFLSQNRKITERGTTLKSFNTHLPKIQFGRIQHGIIVNFNEIDKVLRTRIQFKGETINISKKYKDEFLDQWESFKEARKA